MTNRRGQLSLAMLVLSSATMIAMSGARLVADASFWGDEAAIAYNVISMRPSELMGALDTGHQFPRLYLGLINQLRLAVGYETIVMRTLPFVFFVAGVVLWHRLLWLRFRSNPGLIALGCLLTLVPGDWFAYGAMFKQYSLDVLVALLPFLIADSTLDRMWRDGEGRGRIALQVLPCLVSLSYGIALLGRWVGYGLGSARRQGVPPTGTWVGLAAGLSGAMALSYGIDLRHAFENRIAFDFWGARGCLASGDPVADVTLIGRWLVDWFVGKNPFGGRLPVLPAVATGLLVAAGAGALRVIGERVRPGVGPGPDLEDARATSTPPGAVATPPGAAATPPGVASTLPGVAERAAWGTRSLSAAATVGGLFAAGLLLSYPLCANRLTLFAFFSLLLVTLEGVAWAGESLARRGRGAWAEAIPLMIALAVGPSAAATVEALLTQDAPENLRPLLAQMARAPQRTVVVGYCSAPQALTLPEWIERDDIVYAHDRMAEGRFPIPVDQDVWLVTTGGGEVCRAWTQRVRERATRFDAVTPAGRGAMLFSVRVDAAASSGGATPQPGVARRD